MNYQFFGTAGIFSGVLWVAAFTLFIIIESNHFSWDTEDKITIAALICFLLPFAFWLVIGVLCGLDTLWGWGMLNL